MFEVYALFKFVLALFLGGAIGWQREHVGKEAGPRTYGLVTAGACLFTVISAYAFGSGDSRIASTIVTGIGFLGAGMILQREDRISGLTTAAGLWVASAIGIAVGLNYYLLAIFTTIVIFLTLMINDNRLAKTTSEKKKNKK